MWMKARVAGDIALHDLPCTPCIQAIALASGWQIP